MTWPEIAQFAAQSAASAVLTSLAFIGLAPTKLGEKFLNHHLERKLATLRHDQNRQIEELRAKLAHLGDRGVRSNEKEFQAIAAAWEHFVDAYAATMLCAIAYSSHPDLGKLSDDETTRYLESSDLSEQQRARVMAASDRNKALARAVEMNQINAAGLAIYTARNLIGKQAIFIPDELLSAFELMMKNLSAAQIQRSIEPNYGAYGLKHVEWLLTNGDAARQELLTTVRKRIFRAEIADLP